MAVKENQTMQGNCRAEERKEGVSEKERKQYIKPSGLKPDPSL